MQQLWLYDKTMWQKGAWTDEPDFATWVDGDTLYRCVVQRNEFGAWTGAVGIVENHPLFMVRLPGGAYRFIDIHGGVMSAMLSVEIDDNFVPPKRAWWIGFDCMHNCDLLPPLAPGSNAPRMLPRREIEDTRDRFPAVYRDFDYVRNEVGFLAMQLAFYEDDQ